MKQVLMIVLALLMTGIAGTARAQELNDQEVAKVVKLLGEGKMFYERVGNPTKQVFSFDAGGLEYRIDLRTHLCFALFSAGAASIPCKSVKKGYPVLAPLITWDD